MSDPIAIDDALRRWRDLNANVATLIAPPELPRPVVLPASAGTRNVVNLTPLLALLLRQYGVPVLVHGSAASPGCVATGAVLAELGVAAARDIADTQARLWRDRLAYVALEALVPELASQSDERMFAQLVDPFAGDAFLVVGVARAEELAPMRTLLSAAHASALLLVGAEGEPFVDPRWPSPLEHFAHGVPPQCADAVDVSASGSIALPDASDVSQTAEWTERAIVGELPIPASLLTELACCLVGAHR